MASVEAPAWHHQACSPALHLDAWSMLICPWPPVDRDIIHTYIYPAGIAVVAYASLGAGALLQDPVVQAVATKVNRSPAQVGSVFVLTADSVAAADMVDRCRRAVATSYAQWYVS